MKYAFLTTLIPKQMADEVANYSKYNMQDAANALQWHIYDGFCDNFKEDIKILNVLPIGSFPQYYSKPFIKKSLFDTEMAKNHVNIGFCNVKLIRKYRQTTKIFTELKKWCKEDDEEKTLFVYTASASFLKAVSKIKKQYPMLKVCVIIADLPNMFNLSSNISLLQKLFNKRQATVAYSSMGCVDAFVLLTKQMADYMNLTKPYVVMEGISTFHNFVKTEEKSDTKKILYTGTLHKKFGVLNLVKAFSLIEDLNYELLICGCGDSEDEISKMSIQDSRIHFMGQLRREEILKLQQEATILVNPRQNNEEFTKYSFPSKNLEYLSSGIPLVAYKLDGIPNEYDDYINYVKDDSIEALRDTLVSVCEDTDGIACIRAQKAVEFVKSEKNAQKQTLKIKNMVDAL